MSWLKTYAVALPEHGVSMENERMKYSIQLSQQDNCIENSSVSISSIGSITGPFITKRSYSEFRMLRKHLYRYTKPLALSKRRSRWSMTISNPPSTLSSSSSLNIPVDHGCSCSLLDQDNSTANGQCPFQPLHAAIMSYPFPSKLINTKTKAGRIHARRLEGRRKGLERFLHLLEAYFQTFSTFLLEKKLYRDGCAVLTAYGTFMGVFDHFPSLTRSCISAPLTLKAWRENLEASILKACEEEEEEEEEEQQQQQQQEEEELQTKAQPVPVPELEQISTNVSKESVVSCLPRLTIRSTNVETMQTFLEDFCDHLLTHYGNDLEELQDEDSTLTLARRWELCLFVAARIGHTYAVQLILFYYVHDPNITLHDGSTCLNIASRMGHSEIVSILLQEKADVHQPNQAGITPLIAASRNGCLEVVKILLNAGARVTDKSARGTFPLHAAIVSQNEEIVELLLQHGADVDVCTESGIAPLHFAAKLGNLKICELLIAYNVNVYQRTKNNSDAYAIAIANEHTKVAQLLEQALHSRRCGRHSTGNIFSNIHTAASPPSVDGVYPTVIPSPPRTSVSSTRCGSRTSGGRGLLYRGRSVFTNFALAAGSLSMSNRHLNMHETTQRSRHHHQS